MLRVDKDVFWFCTVKSDIRDIDKSEFAENNKVMKTIYLIGGTMGVGKTTVCQKMKETLPNAVFWTVTGVGMPIRLR